MPMSADFSQILRVLVACGLIGHCGALAADEDELPDIEFLEYLGSWDESDADWQVVSEVDRIREQVSKDERTDPAPDGEESTETENEG
jgi:hypothetical protein